MKKNVVGQPLAQLQPFIGEWSAQGTHAQVPNAVIRGHSVFEWWGERVFLMHRSTFEHPDFPDSISLIGATRSDGGLALHYFDTRAVQRVYDMTFGGGVWTLSRKAAGPDDFDQRMTAKFSVDRKIITAEWELTDPGKHEMRHDFALTYTRTTRR